MARLHQKIPFSVCLSGSGSKGAESVAGKQRREGESGNSAFPGTILEGGETSGDSLQIRMIDPSQLEVKAIQDWAKTRLALWW